MHTACVNPAIIKIEQGTDRDGIVNSLISEACFMQNGDVSGLYVDGIFIHLSDKTEKNFFGIGQRAGFHILQNACHQFMIVQQFRCDRSV